MNLNRRKSITLLILLLFFISIPALTLANEKIIKIVPGDEADTINMLYEVTLMMEDLGYSWHPVLNESTEQYLKVAEEFDQYRMLFKLNSNPSIQVKVHVRETDNVTGIYFTETGKQAFSDFANKQYQRLLERIKHEFGAKNVTENSFSLFTP